jgi:hypothetical protein
VSVVIVFVIMMCVCVCVCVCVFVIYLICGVQLVPIFAFSQHCLYTCLPACHGSSCKLIVNANVLERRFAHLNYELPLQLA